jgi:hypothetical protein
LEYESGEKSVEDLAQKTSEPGQDAAEIVAGGAENGVGRVAGATLKIAASQMSVLLHVTDHRLDGGAAFELTLDGAEDAALLSGNEDAARVVREFRRRDTNSLGFRA